MNRLKKAILVDYFLYHAEEIDLGSATAFLGPNGTGKSAILDAVQIVLLAADRRHLRFNSKKQSRGDDKRTIPGYCLGTTDGGGNARDVANTYITLVFENEKTGRAVSIGVAFRVDAGVQADPLMGLYVVNGAALTLGDHTEYLGDVMASTAWDDFRHRLDKKRSADCIVTITDRNEQFLRTALHALQAGHRPIDLAEYVKAVRQSLTLSSDRSASDFVRDVLVGEEKVNRSKARELITVFRQLKNLIKEIEEKIGALDGVAKLYKSAERAYAQAATWRGLAATYAYELAVHRHDDAKEALAARRADLVDAKETQQVRQGLKEAASDARDQAERLLNNQSVQGELRAREAELQTFRATLRAEAAPLQQALTALRRCVEGVAPLPEVEPLRRELTSLSVSLQQAAQSPEAAASEGLRDLVGKAHELLTRAQPLVAKAQERAQRRFRAAESEFDVQHGLRETLRQGGKVVPRGPMEAIGFLAGRGFAAVPACNLVTVTDPDWQPAIEGFLQANRFLLIVKERNQEALGALRRDGKHLRFTKMAQTMRSDNWPVHDKSLVGNLLAGDPWALWALRLKLGRMKLAATEKELDGFDRGLSMDGWCATGGTIERLHAPEEGLFLGSTAPVPAAPRQQDDRYRHAHDEYLAAKKDQGAVQALATQLAQALTDHAPREVGILLGTALAVRARVEQGEVALRAIDTSAVDALRAAAQAAREALGSAEAAWIEAQAAAVRAEGLVQTAVDAVAAAAVEQERAKVVETDAHAQYGFDATEADARRRQQLQQGQLKFTGAAEVFDEFKQMEVWIGSLRHDADNRARLAGERVGEGHTEFQNYISKYGDSFHENRKDYLYNLRQIEAERERLASSELQTKNKEADEALLAAEEAFRKDVALKVRDAIDRMESTRNDMNRILSLCPPFSNNERYRFHYEVVPHYEKIHQYIMASRNADSGVFASGGDDETMQAVIRLIEEAADPAADKATNPLDDFRLLFTYDLHVYQGDKKVGTLGKRMGTGSNGEHLTPFYVVAGATLAHSFRLDSRGAKDGFGIMVIDEAFAAMDEQNALSAAQFLQTLGLQLLMAGPNDSLGKISPFATDVYDLFRVGHSLGYQRTQLKAAANDLMRSDMPSVHPELIAGVVAQLRQQKDAGNAPDHAAGS